MPWTWDHHLICQVSVIIIPKKKAGSLPSCAQINKYKYKFKSGVTLYPCTRHLHPHFHWRQTHHDTSYRHRHRNRSWHSMTFYLCRIVRLTRTSTHTHIYIYINLIFLYMYIYIYTHYIQYTLFWNNYCTSASYKRLTYGYRTNSRLEKQGALWPRCNHPYTWFVAAFLEANTCAPFPCMGCLFKGIPTDKVDGGIENLQTYPTQGGWKEKLDKDFRMTVTLGRKSIINW